MTEILKKVKDVKKGEYITFDDGYGMQSCDSTCKVLEVKKEGISLFPSEEDTYYIVIQEMFGYKNKREIGSYREDDLVRIEVH